MAAEVLLNREHLPRFGTPENRLLNVAFPDGTNEGYSFSQDGLRKSKTNGSGTTLDRLSVVLQELRYQAFNAY